MSSTLLVGLESLVLALKPHSFVSKADFYILFFLVFFIFVVPFSSTKHRNRISLKDLSALDIGFQLHKFGLE